VIVKRYLCAKIINIGQEYYCIFYFASSAANDVIDVIRNVWPVFIQTVDANGDQRERGLLLYITLQYQLSAKQVSPVSPFISII